jgi:hypothetical protein
VCDDLAELHSHLHHAAPFLPNVFCKRLISWLLA